MKYKAFEIIKDMNQNGEDFYPPVGFLLKYDINLSKQNKTPYYSSSHDKKYSGFQADQDHLLKNNNIYKPVE